MNQDRAKYWFLEVIKSHLNRPYIWGGDDFSGFDCSGLAIEGLKAIGRFPLSGDSTADSLWSGYKSDEVNKPVEGCMLFWFNNKGKAIHVAIAVGPEHCITADGGGSKTHTIQDAIDQNAYIKVRRIDHRKTYPRIINIFQED